MSKIELHNGLTIDLDDIRYISDVEKTDEYYEIRYIFKNIKRSDSEISDKFMYNRFVENKDELYLKLLKIHSDIIKIWCNNIPLYSCKSLQLKK